VTLCHWTNSSRRFGRPWCLHFQDQADLSQVYHHPILTIYQIKVHRNNVNLCLRHWRCPTEHPTTILLHPDTCPALDSVLPSKSHSSQHAVSSDQVPRLHHKLLDKFIKIQVVIDVTLCQFLRNVLNYSPDVTAKYPRRTATSVTLSKTKQPGVTVLRDLSLYFATKCM